jgi:hypothetical protein
MAKKKVQLKKIPSVKKAIKASARKAEPKKKVKAVPANKLKRTEKKPQPKKKTVRTLPANKAKKTQPRMRPMGTLAAGKASKKLPTKQPPTYAPNTAELVATMPDGGPIVAKEPATYPNLRRRVGELLNKLNDSALQWLHFEITDPDAEGEIETDEEAEEARDNFPPLNRPALVQELTTIAVDDFHLADDSDLAERLRDENSIGKFLIDNK